MPFEPVPGATKRRSAAARPAVRGRRQTTYERLGGGVGVAAIAALVGASGASLALGVEGARLGGTAGTAVVAGALVVGLGALSIVRRRFANARRGTSIVSECPVCGHRTGRSFARGPTICGACPAYLEARDLVVSEVDEAAWHAAPDFALPLRLVEALPGGPRFPDACMVCGKPGLRRRAVSFFDERALAARAQESLFPDHSTAYSASRGRRRDGDHGGAHVATFIRSLAYPVCGEDHAEGDLFPVAYTPLSLGFSSYRAYKAFCAQNGIASLRGPALRAKPRRSTIPRAR
jgi:hypothetical protein